MSGVLREELYDGDDERSILLLVALLMLAATANR